MKKCARCKKIIPNREFLSCSQCKLCFDLDCENVSIARYLRMTLSHRTNWRCTPCIQKHAPVNKTSTNTNKTSEIFDRKQHVTSVEGVEISTENITTRRKIKNPRLGTEQSIVDAKAILTKSCSLESLDMDLSLNNTCSEVASRSYDLSTNANSADLEEMKEINSELKLQLASTQAELENKILENIDLKKNLNTLEQQIITLKTICTTPISEMKNSTTSSKKERRKQLKQLLQTPTPIERKTKSPPSLTNKIETDSLTPSLNLPLTKPIPLSETSLLDTSQEAEQQRTHKNIETEEENVENKHESSNPTKTKKIYILGGQQCMGLRKKLEKSRSLSKYEDYELVSYIKPGADSEEIAKNHTWLKVDKEDRVILSLGEHDRNPARLMIEFSTILKRLHKCQLVIVLGIKTNSHLNEVRLNSMLKNICTNFVNCTYIDIDKLDLFTLWSGATCRKLNSIIDQFDYDSKYLTYNKLKPVSYTNKPRTAPEQQKSQSSALAQAKKGTIPFYFKKISKRAHESNVEQSEKTFFRP